VSADQQEVSEAVDRIVDDLGVDVIEDEAERLGIPAMDLIDRVANEMKMRVEA